MKKLKFFSPIISFISISLSGSFSISVSFRRCFSPYCHHRQGFSDRQRTSVYIICLKIPNIGSSIVILIGSVIKTIALERDQFWLLLIGQILSQGTRAIGQPYGGRLANLWFNRNEISKAVGICSGGFTLGAGLGYVIPALVVVDQSAGAEKMNHPNETVSEIDYDLIKTEMRSLHSSQGFLGHSPKLTEFAGESDTVLNFGQGSLIQV